MSRRRCAELRAAENLRALVLRPWLPSGISPISRMQAKRIVAKGGAVGLWGLTRTASSLDRYASELLCMAELIGAEHVMFGTDADGLGAEALIEDFGDMRKVVEILSKRGVEDRVLRGICIENYARCLKRAMHESVALAGRNVSG